MRVCQVTKYFHPHQGGIESVVLGISTGISMKETETTILTSNKPKTKRRERIGEIDVYRYTPWFNVFNASFIPGILWGLLRLEYDVVHLHLPDPFCSFFVLMASLFKKRPLVVTYHADIIKNKWYHAPFRIVYGPFQDMVLKRADVVTATSPNYVKGSDVLPRFEGKVKIVPNFIDLGRFDVADHPGTEIREKYDIGDKKVVLFVGRLIPYKGVNVLLRAFHELNKRMGGLHLIIVGEGPLREDLVKLADDLGLKDITFTGRISDNELLDYYACCDLFVLPSVTRAEAFGVVLLEAMAFKKPVVSSNISGMPYVVGEGGKLVDPGDVNGLMTAMGEILEDPDFCRAYGKQGRRRLEQMFTKDVVIKKVLAIYDEVGR